jgi:hypothetical protein
VTLKLRDAAFCSSTIKGTTGRRKKYLLCYTTTYLKSQSEYETKRKFAGCAASLLDGLLSYV